MNKNMQKKLWIGLAILIVLTPLGLLATGTAFGEWSSEELQQTLGYVPDGVKKGETLWQAIFSGYSVPGLQDSFFHSSIGYIFSAIGGAALIYFAMLALGKFIAGKEEEQKNENS